jgi:hypothetical protein
VSVAQELGDVGTGAWTVLHTQPSMATLRLTYTDVHRVINLFCSYRLQLPVSKSRINVVHSAAQLHARRSRAGK